MPRPLTALRRPAAPVHDVLGTLAGFVNPGALGMRTFVPPTLKARAPLVVVLHGCTQTAAGYDHAAGWSRLAGALGFALLLPEQVRSNNANGCFNWFEAADVRRGSGEVASIAAAVAAMVAEHDLDASRVFVTGLSAGGAMTAALLATYPDVFAGGAIIAGLPFGVANGVGEAMAAMANPLPLTAAALGDRVRAATTFTGPWPRVSVWHGTDDRTVAPANGAQIAAQWADVHGATSDGSVWRNAAGVAVVELIEVAGMGHGTPIDCTDGGIAAPYMLDVGIASSARIAAAWGLGTAPRQRHDPVRPATRPAEPTARDVAAVIGKALRSAGLMR